MLDPWKNPAVWHAINVHLPIVLAILGLPLVCLLAITRGKSRGLRWGVVFFYAAVTVAAWFTVQTGERAMGALPPTISAAAAQRVELHERLAVKLPILAAATTFFLLLATIPRRWARQTFTTLGLVMSVLTAGWIAVTAHSGGLAVYDFGLGTVAMNAPPPPSNQPLAPAQADSLMRKRDVAPTTQASLAPLKT